MWAKNSNGEVDPLTREKFFDALAVTELAINDGLINSGRDALTGAPLIVAALELWSNEGRFSRVVGEFEEIKWGRDRVIWDKDDILVTLPTKDGNNLVNNTVQTSDAASLHQEQGAANPDDIVIEETEVNAERRYDRQRMINYANDSESIFANKSKEEQDVEISSLIETYPEHEKEIKIIFSTSEYRKINDTKEKQKVKTTSEEPEKQTVTRRGVEFTKGTAGTDEELAEFMKTFKSPFIKERIRNLKKAIDTNKYGSVGSLLSKQTGTPYRKLTQEQREVAAKALIDELLKDIG